MSLCLLQTGLLDNQAGLDTGFSSMVMLQVAQKEALRGYMRKKARKTVRASSPSGKKEADSASVHSSFAVDFE